ncbi:hypothetical protein CF65_00733 [Aggregatibacter actinomycetemcomitans HK1651]|nr:hypothetical protein CF65_00733 [Aggregatibacter actinomycetemcomitans HK1651]
MRSFLKTFFNYHPIEGKTYEDNESSRCRHAGIQ